MVEKARLVHTVGWALRRCRAAKYSGKNVGFLCPSKPPDHVKAHAATAVRVRYLYALFKVSIGFKANYVHQSHSRRLHNISLSLWDLINEVDFYLGSPSVQ